jgi:hypothetical protein
MPKDTGRSSFSAQDTGRAVAGGGPSRRPLTSQCAGVWIDTDVVVNRQCQPTEAVAIAAIAMLLVTRDQADGVRRSSRRPSIELLDCCAVSACTRGGRARDRSRGYERIPRARTRDSHHGAIRTRQVHS